MNRLISVRNLQNIFILQVIKGRASHDDIRLRALEGFSDLSTSQLYDYPAAVKAMELAISEYELNPIYEPRVDELRQKAARLYRVNLQNSERAIEILKPLLVKPTVKTEVFQEAGKKLNCLT